MRQSPRRRSIFTSRLVSSAAEGEQPRVVEDLRHAILAGDEPPGTPIPLESVAAFFGVSQIPVREALKVLTGEGLVTHQPRVGYAVSQLAFDELEELYDVRAALEAAALRRAAERAGPEHDAEPEACHAAIARAIAASDDREYHAASRRFHLALIAPAGMPRLTHLLESAWNMTEPARPMAAVPADRRLDLHDDHARMLEAFLARDADRLLAESGRHFAHLRAAVASMRGDPDTVKDTVRPDRPDTGDGYTTPVTGTSPRNGAGETPAS